MKTHLDRHASSADITLLLEGTFPYVHGGVSTWVHNLIRAFPQYTFALVFIGGQRADYGAPVFKLPANVVHFEQHFIHETRDTHPVAASRGDPDTFDKVGAFHDALRGVNQPTACPDSSLQHFVHTILSGGSLDENAFLYSESSWNMIRDRYETYCTDPSFTDYFWTVRTIHRPIWQLVQISETMLSTSLCHTVSTGYAGLLGALLSMRQNIPLLVSEHGIYTKERKIELLQSQWVKDNRGTFEKDRSEPGYLQALWIRFFESIGRLCYSRASDIISLYEGNRQRQMADGAPEARTAIIPNGIDIGHYASLRLQRTSATPPVVGFIGRLVSIKDVKTFIRAVFIARHTMPALQGWIIGPENEEPQYAQECHDLVMALNARSYIKFWGVQRIDEFLPKISLLVLTSISEGLPMVLLEAFAAGVPAVSTDVGACRSLIEGYGATDKALGLAGRVVPIADAEQTASAMTDLLQAPMTWHAAQQAAIARVERYYTSTLMEQRYDNLYQKLLTNRALPVEEH